MSKIWDELLEKSKELGIYEGERHKYINTHESNKISKYIATKAATGQDGDWHTSPLPVQFQKAYSIRKIRLSTQNYSDNL